MPIFTLTEAIINLAREAFDDLLRSLQKPCRLYYPSITIPCSCGSNPIGKFPSNNWITGGSAPGSNLTNCPLCGGNGTTQQEAYEDINFLINESPKTFGNLPKGVLLPDGIIQTKTHLTELPKIVKCEYMLSQTNIEGYQHRRYTLYGDPTDSSNSKRLLYKLSLEKSVLMSRLGRFVRLTSDVLNIKGFENELKEFIEDTLYDTLLKLKPRILDKAGKLVKLELEASPEVKSLLGGTLRGDFGFYKGREHDFIDPVINKIVDNIEINIIRQNFIPGKVLISFKVVLFDGDYDQLLTLPLSQYTSEGNVESEIEWLRWLLLEGDKVIIRGYNIDRDVSGNRIAFSRSEQALMAKVAGGAWKVPSQFSGTESNNFITRSIDNIEPEILKTLEYLL